MSQSVDVSILVVGLAELLRAVTEAGCEAMKQSEFQTEDGRTHAVDLVVKDEQGTEVGVKVDQKTGVATFVGHEGKDKRATKLANRVAQRYAYSKVLDELKRKGYQIAKEEKQKDGTIHLVAQRWR
jgi:Protein of unknown function (DUF1257)